MSAAGLEVFDRTLQITHIWLDDIMKELGPDRKLAWRALSVVLHEVRDRLPVELAAHLGAQLPLLVRGVYYDQFTPAAQPYRGSRDLDDLADAVAVRLADARPVDPREAILAVLRTLSRHVSAPQIEKVQDALPRDLRRVWRAAEEDVVPPAPPRARAGRRHEARAS